jgi:hypothetical protein
MALTVEPPTHDAKTAIVALPENGIHEALGTARRRGLTACDAQDDNRFGFLYRA